ncbi:MAG: helix-hairpin-helix domain-containing protein [Candidatus Saccharibacteria bacterium]|nr:helix-hairpin-helix domain-containing protein [Rhodoferax sp.]
MLKKILTVLAMFYALAAFAAVDVNKATAADLDGIKGIGPAISGKIIDERKKGSFKDWSDFITRVNGVGDGNAAKFSAEGLTVNGSAFAGAAPAAKKDDKPAAKADAKPAATAAPAAKVDAKAQAKADMEAAKKAKADEKAAKKAAAKEAKEAKVAKPAQPAASAAKK